MSTAPCKIQMNDDGDRVCMACGGTRDFSEREPIDCPHRTRAPTPDTSGYQIAAIILALCFGLSTCTVVDHYTAKRQSAKVEAKP